MRIERDGEIKVNNLNNHWNHKYSQFCFMCQLYIIIIILNVSCSYKLWLGTIEGWKTVYSTLIEGYSKVVAANETFNFKGQ